MRYTWKSTGNNMQQGRWRSECAKGRRKESKILLDLEKIESLYLTENLPCHSIAELFGCHATTIQRKLKKRGVKLRPCAFYIRGHIPYNRKSFGNEEIVRLYVEDGLSQEEIAKQRGVCTSTIGNRLSEAGVKRRSPSEAGKLSYKKGRKPWNWSKKTGIVPLHAWKKGHIPHNKGKPMPEWWKMKLRKQKTFTPESREAIRKARREQMLSGHGKRIRANVNPNKLGASVRRFYKEHPERREKIRREVTEYYSNPQHRKEQSKRIRKAYADNPKLAKRARARILNQYAKGDFPQQDTDIERAIRDELLRRGYKANEDFIREFAFKDKFSCDFAFPEEKLVVECYGDYWHAHPKKYKLKTLDNIQQQNGKQDRAREAYIRKCGWKLFIFWEYDIKKDVKACVDKIEKCLRAHPIRGVLKWSPRRKESSFGGLLG